MSKTLNLSIGTLSILFLVTLTSFMWFTPEKGKYFTVANAKTLKMSSKTEMLLTQAFKSVYGKRIGFERLTVEKIEGKPWLAVYGSEGTVGVPLVIDGSEVVIDMGVDAAVICRTVSGCSCCKVDSCACGKRGGTRSCGSTSCNKDPGLKDDWNQIREKLSE